EGLKPRDVARGNRRDGEGGRRGFPGTANTHVPDRWDQWIWTGGSNACEETARTAGDRNPERKTLATTECARLLSQIDVQTLNEQLTGRHVHHHETDSRMASMRDGQFCQS